MAKAEQIYDLREVKHRRLWVCILLGKVQNHGGFGNRELSNHNSNCLNKIKLWSCWEGIKDSKDPFSSMLTVSFPKMEVAMWSQILGEKVITSTYIHFLMQKHFTSLSHHPQFQFYNYNIQLYPIQSGSKIYLSFLKHTETPVANPKCLGCSRKPCKFRQTYQAGEEINRCPYVNAKSPG